MKNVLVVCIAFGLVPLIVSAQGRIDFEENLVQYPAQVKYKVGVGEGTTLFMEQNCFTYMKYDPAQLELIHENSHRENGNPRKEGVVDMHAFRMSFLGANPAPTLAASEPRSFHTNYFIGSDPAKWASNVNSYGKINYSDLYNGIDLAAYNVSNQFKYDFIVAPHADPALIKMNFSGTSGIEILNHVLIIHLSTGDIEQQIPYSYQEINGLKYPVPCEYRIDPDGQTVTFHFPDGYDESHSLIIDPTVVAATFSGAPASVTTYGHCATSDPAGLIYTGGECFHAGYPTQVGSYQTNFAGNVDIAVSCLNANGSLLLWSTYLGGTGRETPNSLFAIAGGELYVLGVSNSSNYPTTAGCFDATYNGTSGSDDDIVVTHINNTGTALVGSTYIGGPQNDGGGWGIPWNMNGHDGMRGEIIVDASGNAWVASFTESPAFPTTVGTYDDTLDGTWDGVVFRLDASCSNLGWSTFIGGTAADGAYALRINTAGEVYCSGVTCSNDFPATAGTYNVSNSGGTSEGFIARFNSTGTALLAATYFGTPQNEICYFIDLDPAENPCVFGSSTGSMPVTVGVYNNSGAGNFVSMFDAGLTTLQYSTVFGGAPASFLEPQAFVVDNNGYIYCAGFNSQATYPVTPATAIYSTQASCSNGSCYFIILSPNATQLTFGSFYFGWHVDGGTSRFSDDGVMNLGICIGAGNAPNSSWAYGDNLNAPGWDMYVLKVDFAWEVGIHPSLDESQNRVHVFPNPAVAESEVEINSPYSDQIQLRIYNTLGELVWSELADPTGITTRIPLPDLDAGHYIIEVAQSGMVRRSKFMSL